MHSMNTDPTRVAFDLSKTVTAIASELGFAPTRVRGTIDLLSDGSTIPFIARYRKERTGGLDEVQIGAVEDALTAATELIDRKNRVLKSLFQQGVRDSALEHAPKSKRLAFLRPIWASSFSPRPPIGRRSLESIRGLEPDVRSSSSTPRASSWLIRPCIRPPR